MNDNSTNTPLISMLTSVTRITFLFLVVVLSGLTVYAEVKGLSDATVILQAFLTLVGMSAAFFYSKSTGGVPINSSITTTTNSVPAADVATIVTPEVTS